jgi:hypothetical protein
VLTILPEPGSIISEQKPAARWCEHCKPGKGGCSRYAERPKVCRDFECQWLADGTVADYWRPTKSHMVMTSDAEERIVYVDVDPAYPNAWRAEPYFSELRTIARYVRVSIKIGERHILLDDRAAQPQVPRMSQSCRTEPPCVIDSP